MKISIADLKRKLTPETEFTAEFIGVNRNLAKPDMICTKRKVVSNKSQMVSLILEGSNSGRQIYLGWSGTTARQEGNDIILTMEGEDFLKITI